MSRSWKPLSHSLTERKQQKHDTYWGHWKGGFLLFCLSLLLLPTHPLSNLLGLACTFLPIPCLWSTHSFSIPPSNPILALHFPALLFQPWRWRQYVSPKFWHLHTKLHNDKTQNIKFIMEFRLEDHKLKE
jgi:hypothetical protein